MKIALVTGASSGLGREFVRQIAEQGKVEEIWAIARRRDRLEALQSISAVPIRVLALDLTRPGDMEYLRNTLQDELPDIRILVNAAGMGRMGPTVDIPAKDNDAMIDLNCRAAVDVTDAAFPYLHPGSQVLEICSTAGFQPIPGLNVYAATKALIVGWGGTLFYTFVFRFLRARTGGYHAKTPHGCLLGSVCCQSVMLFLSAHMPDPVVSAFIAGFSCLSIALFGPANHPELHLSEKELKALQPRIYIRLLIVVALTAVLLFFRPDWGACTAFGVFAAALLLVISLQGYGAQ